MASSSSTFHRCGGGYTNINKKQPKPPWSPDDDVAAPRRRMQKLTVSSSPAKMATEDSIPSCPLQRESINSPDDSLPTILITAEDLGLDNPQEAIKKLASRPASPPKSLAQKPPAARPKTASTFSRTRRAQSPRRNARPMTAGSRRSQRVGRGTVRKRSGHEGEGWGLEGVKPQPMPAWSVTELLDDDEADDEISDPSELDMSMSSLHALTDNEPIAEDTVESLAGGDTLRSDDPIRKLIEGPPVDDAEYDTDLEDEFSPDKEMIYDSAGKNVYLAECKQEGVDPASYVLRHLHETTFRMRHRYLSMQALIPLAKAFKSNTCTETLDLRDNHLESDEGAVIALMMRDNCYITTLDISENLIGSTGVSGLSSMLETNYTLKTLRLSANHLSDRDALRLSEGLKNSSTLTEIDLSYNELGESAGVHLGSALCFDWSARVLTGIWPPDHCYVRALSYCRAACYKA